MSETLYTYIDYKNSGYSVIPSEEEFARYFFMAEKKIKRYIKTFAGTDDANKRCVYETADILYAGQNQLNRQVSGFSNENYREQYFRENKLSADEQIWETLRLYFTHEELCRGVRKLC